MKVARVNSLVWTTIYLGLVLLALGFSLGQGGSPVLASIFLVVGAASTAVGIALIWWRSRTRDGL